MALEGLRVRRVAAAEAVLRAELLAWALAEGQEAGLRALVPTWDADEERPLSRWRVSGLLVVGLRSLVLGQWSVQRVAECWPRLRRYSCDSPRRRRQQETEVRNWLRRWLPAMPEPVPAAA